MPVESAPTQTPRCCWVLAIRCIMGHRGEADSRVQYSGSTCRRPPIFGDTVRGCNHRPGQINSASRVEDGSILCLSIGPAGWAADP